MSTSTFTPPPLHRVLASITQRIANRSRTERGDYQDAMRSRASHPLPGLDARAGAAKSIRIRPPDMEDCARLGVIHTASDQRPDLAQVEGLLEIARDEAQRQGANVRVLSGVPCPVGEISPFKGANDLGTLGRDLVALCTAMALAPARVDALIVLGATDSTTAGLLVGTLHFGHIPTVFVPVGGLPVMLRALGLQLPDAECARSDADAQEALVRDSVRTALRLSAPPGFNPLGCRVDERALVNAVVISLALGCGTDVLLQLVAVARAAAIQLDWTDVSDLSDIVPLLAQPAPSDQDGVQAPLPAGATEFVLRELLGAGLLHPAPYGTATDAPAALDKVPCPDPQRLYTALQPLLPQAGVRMLQGNLGRSMVFASAVPAKAHVVEAACRIFDSCDALQDALQANQLRKPTVCVVRWQGPRANGMQDMRAVKAPLELLQRRGVQVALVTDGRMSQEGSTVPMAMLVSPESSIGGPLAKLQDGDVIRLDLLEGTLDALVTPTEWADRPAMPMPDIVRYLSNAGGMYPLLAALRRSTRSAEEGACSWL